MRDSDISVKDGLKERIRKRIEKLKSRYAYQALLSDLTLPNRLKLQNQRDILNSLKILESKLPKLQMLIKSLRKSVPNIWDQTNMSAVYLLLGKSFSNLKVLILLGKEGYSLELVDIARSGQESIDLAFLFLEEGQEKRLASWFKGKTIENEKARKLLHKVINNWSKTVSTDNVRLPILDAKSEIYRTYSLFTHSCYPALLDLIDVFHEDLDFEKHSGFHYSKQYLYLVFNLAINILFELKNVFSKIGDDKGFSATNVLLKEIGYENATPSEVKEIFSKYKN